MDSKTPLDYYVAKLQSLDYVVRTLELRSTPLPEDRVRVWILCSQASEPYSSQLWLQDVEKLNDLDSEMPRHHLKAFFDAYGKPCHEVFHGKAKSKASEYWTKDADYAVAYAQSMKHAVGGKRLKPDHVKVPEAARPSVVHAEKLGALTPNQRAQVDVYAEICRQMEATARGKGLEGVFPVADISQTSYRGHVDLSGLWGTLCTSTRLMNMTNYEVMSGTGLMCMMGHSMGDKHTEGLTDGDLAKMAGNGMAFTQLSKVLLPLVAQWVKSNQAQNP